MNPTLTPFCFFKYVQQNAQDESVPLSLLAKVESAKHEERDLSGFLLSCKDFRVISLFFLHPESLGTINSLFKHLLFPPKIGYPLTQPPLYVSRPSHSSQC